MKKNGKISRVTIHITATPSTTTVQQIRNAHKSQGWADIGYHWLVDSNGVIHKGRDEMYIGSHVGGHNTNNIGISYIARGSDIDSNAKPYYKYMTELQRQGLITITAEVLKRHGLTVKELYGHNDFTKMKACPCFKVRESDFIKDVQKKMGVEANIVYERKSPMMQSNFIGELQTLLKKLKHYNYIVTNIFGDVTKKAVEDYQRCHGLTVNGKVDKGLAEYMGLKLY